MNTDTDYNKQLSSLTTQHSEILEACSVFSVASDDFHSTNSNSSDTTTIADLVAELEQLKKISQYTTGTRSVASWKKSEVAKLANLVFEFGTDFARVANIMGRDRDQVKRKFKTMQKKDSNFGFVCRKN